MDRVVVVGGGASGMMAAIAATGTGALVILLEKTRRLGNKLRITGKGRANITNQGEIEDFMANYGSTGRFLYNAFARFFNTELIDFFRRRGVAITVERGRRVFPASGRAETIVHCLENELRRGRVQVRKNWPVQRIIINQQAVTGVVSTTGTELAANAVIVATGGLSYPATGSTGDGYRWAREAGHKIIDLKPALVPLETAEREFRSWAGLSLKNVRLTIIAAGQPVGRIFGDMLFTHTGVSGPIILSISKEIGERLERGQSILLAINFKPALSAEQVDRRLQREFAAHGRQQVSRIMCRLAPAVVAAELVRRAQLKPTVPGSAITRGQRQALAAQLMDFRIRIRTLRPIAEAVVTAGGVDVNTVDPRTMESRIIRGLYFCGEILDIDGATGGYNLQAAFTTGYLAGVSAGRQVTQSSS